MYVCMYVVLESQKNKPEKKRYKQATPADYHADGSDDDHHHHNQDLRKESEICLAGFICICQ